MIQGVSLSLFLSPKCTTDRHVTQLSMKSYCSAFIWSINFFIHRVTLLVAMELEADLFTASSSKTRTSTFTTPAPESSPWPTPARTPTDPRYDQPLETTTRYGCCVISFAFCANRKIGLKGNLSMALHIGLMTLLLLL